MKKNDMGILLGYSSSSDRRITDYAHNRIGFTPKKINQPCYDAPIWHQSKEHLITIAPTGAGKGVSCIIPTLLEYHGP
ncbi:MAG: type IV secretory system conjugative DNA transfer family protein, partial [Gammaproteobacteria bacterium]|nr:type IV secretory system conjugative DNA transfer family protein [Gammaproteobacteria bacterium]